MHKSCICKNTLITHRFVATDENNPTCKRLITTNNKYIDPYGMFTFVMRCAIWYYLHNFTNVKKSPSGSVTLVRLHFTKSNNPPWMFSTIFKLYKWCHRAKHLICLSEFQYFAAKLKVKKETRATLSYILIYSVYCSLSKSSYWQNECGL